MSRFALIISGEFGHLREFASQPPDIEHKSVRWLPCDPVSKPSFDSKTEKITGPTYTINASDVTEAWAKVSLTAQEISDAKDSEVNSLNGTDYKPLLQILLTVVNDNRAVRAKLNALIDATNQAGTVPKFGAGQVSQIDIDQLKAAIKALL